MTSAQEQSSDEQLLAGIQKRLPSTTFTLQGQPETAAQVVAVIQARIDKRQAVLAARAAYHTAVLAADQEVAETEAIVEDVRATILAMYSTSPDVLGDFGLAPKKPRTPLTVEQKLVAQAKRAATRKARGTLGPKQKAKIVGTVTGSIVVPVDGSGMSVSSGSSASTPAPATAASPPPAVTNGVSTTSH